MGDLLPALRFVWRKHRHWPDGPRLTAASVDVWLVLTDTTIRRIFARDGR